MPTIKPKHYLMRLTGDEIEARAAHHKERLELNAKSTNSVDIVKHLGGEVVISEHPCLYDEPKGLIEIRARNDFTISLRPCSSPLRDNVTIIKSLGYYFLHTDFSPVNKDKPIVFGVGGKYEWHSNRFAGAWLLPKEEFLKKRFEYNDDPIKIAGHFRVFKEFVERRMEYIKTDPSINKFHPDYQPPSIGEYIKEVLAHRFGLNGDEEELDRLLNNKDYIMTPEIAERIEDLLC